MESMMESDDSLNSSFFYEEEDDDLHLDVDANLPSPSKGRSYKAKSTPKPPVATCQRCKMMFKSLNTYKTHVGAHIFKELLLLAPSKADFMPTIISCITKVLKEMNENPVNVGKGPEVQQLLKVLLNPAPDLEGDVEHFKEIVADKIWECLASCKSKATSTSALHSMFVLSCVQLLTKDREVFVSSLNNCVDLRRPVLECFLCSFVNKMFVQAEASFINAIRTPHLTTVYSKGAVDKGDDLDSLEIQQTIHYVGGSAVKSVLAKGIRAGKSENWQNIVHVIQKNILVGELIDAPEETLCEWTRSRNRGGLKFICQNMLTFFMCLCEILKEVEKEDGSLPHSEVSANVHSSDVMSLLWDEIIGDSLDDIQSRLLMSELTVSFTNTWGHGIVLRRQNDLLHVGDAVPLRSKLSK